MEVRIAHLSDLHFGRDFNIELWEQVRRSVVDWKPNLIIVSGDLVDNPSPLHLLAAKSELEELSTESHAPYFVVPGNHDVSVGGWGRAFFGYRRWFRRIFESGDTSAALMVLSQLIGGRPGFTDRCRHQWIHTRVLRSLRRNLRLGGFTARLPKPAERAWQGAMPPPAPDQRQPRRQSSQVHSLALPPVLLALIDSNAPNQWVSFATGSVYPKDLLALDRDLPAVDQPYLARIAVIHHHLLPIAFTGRQRLEDSEALMVLHNAGTVLSVLADHRFDLVLHGHKHRQQFARVEWATNTAELYPISIASAGSAALSRPENDGGDSLNLITIGDNGRIKVESLFYGGARPPRPNEADGKYKITYREPISGVKRRAHSRALERHPLRCMRRDVRIKVTATGDLVAQYSVTGLQVAKSGTALTRRPFVAYVAERGRFVPSMLGLDPRSEASGYSIEEDRAASTPTVRCFWINLPRLPSGEPVTYSARHACANTIKMTSWEAEERARAAEPDKSRWPRHWDKEWVAARIGIPTAELTLSVELPDSMASVQPYVECLRHPEFPRYEIDKDGDAEMPPTSQFESDVEMQEAEQARLQYDAAERRWLLRVEQPMVGYAYLLRWRLPGEAPDTTVHGESLDAQARLLAVADREADAAPGAAAREGGRRFIDLARALDRLLAPDASDDRRGVELFVYDSKPLGLRPAFSWRSWSETPLPSNFTIPLGGGIAGAAFQQRRMVPWTLASIHSPFIEPVAYPAIEGEAPVRLQTILAMPVFHPRYANAPQPPPWSAIGAVCFSSTSPATEVAGMCNPTPSDRSAKVMEEARDLAQILTHAIVDALRGK